MQHDCTALLKTKASTSDKNIGFSYRHFIPRIAVRPKIVTPLIPVAAVASSTYGNPAERAPAAPSAVHATTELATIDSRERSSSISASPRNALPRKLKTAAVVFSFSFALWTGHYYMVDSYEIWGLQTKSWFSWLPGTYSIEWCPAIKGLGLWHTK